MVKRCGWAQHHELEMHYHDHEWGVPIHDDQKLFEMLCLESAQSGLSWLTILQKREGYRRVFADFDIARVARFSQDKRDRLLSDASIVRHKLKIDAVIHNAKRILDIQKEYSSFDAYLWDFVGGKPIQNNPKMPGDVASKTALSDSLSRDLKKRGFKFIGSTTCYAFMQASGMVNDHLVSCYRHSAIKKMK